MHDEWQFILKLHARSRICACYHEHEVWQAMIFTDNDSDYWVATSSYYIPPPASWVARYGDTVYSSVCP
jgi:hypothetical protein